MVEHVRQRLLPVDKTPTPKQVCDYAAVSEMEPDAMVQGSGWRWGGGGAIYEEGYGQRW